MNDRQRAGQAVFAPLALPVLPTYFRFLVYKTHIHGLIARDMADDPSMCDPDIGCARWPPEGPDPVIAEMETDPETRASDQTLRDHNATKPIWQWEYIG